jgi:Ca2+-binding EF-hand superfamily protein
MDFLNPYAPIRYKEKRNDLNEDDLANKLRNKLGENYKELRKAFKQHDYKQTGFICTNSFKNILTKFKADLNDSEMNSLILRLEKDDKGLINYNKLINEIIKL